MSIEKTILKYLNENKNKHNVRYKGVRLGFLGLPDFRHYKYQTLANRCSDLKSIGFIKEINGEYFITHKGEEFLIKNTHYNLRTFISVKTNKDPKDLLLLYDVPEKERTKREWLRRELKNFNFVMIQRSVWVGPSPLPEEFNSYLRVVGLKDAIKTFKLARGFNFTN